MGRENPLVSSNDKNKTPGTKGLLDGGRQRNKRGGRANYIACCRVKDDAVLFACVSVPRLVGNGCLKLHVHITILRTAGLDFWAPYIGVLFIKVFQYQDLLPSRWQR